MAVVLLGMAVPNAARIPAGQLGGPGPCTAAAPVIAGNPAASGQKVYVYQPTGSGQPRIGGTCGDSSRPVAFWTHAYGGNPGPATFIDNLVSNGFIVIASGYASLDSAAYAKRYATNDAGNALGTTLTNRADLTRVGFFGHSQGGGMSPGILLRGVARGWGANALWLAMFAPAGMEGVGTAPAIDLPAHTRVLVTTYSEDYVVDSRIGIEAWTAFDVPAASKEYLLVRSSDTLKAEHFTFGADNALGWYGTHRNTQALAECAILGSGCAADNTYMGSTPNGVAVKPALSSRNAPPTDVDAWPGLVSCTDASYPRRVYCVAGD
ncbi:hypothetical protein [Nonomuraea endophytica]|uniref:Alpha/beta hydrolase n=1 Tax=Nonomuraea endophytica TaxID=714136 RepID=A0A7W8A9A6_9ACTN|nr:hypothetical protein [Nonomuraea endophytica]MBB5081958.1 hypothetical protein [Nonomuraea endophytica]